jgi:hypothetical protein
LGGDDGRIETLQFQAETQYRTFKENHSTIIHDEAINAVALVGGYVLSIGDDLQFKVSNAVTSTIMADLSVGTVNLTAMHVEKSEKRVYIGNAASCIYIFDISKVLSVFPSWTHLV